MKTVRFVLQLVFYLFVLGNLLSRTVTAVISHDENQFIAPGQMLAYQGWLPYRDYPYTHMPYAVPLYAMAAALSPYDLLAGRLLGTLVWVACIVLMIAIVRLIGRSVGASLDGWKSLLPLFAEFVLVFVFLYDPNSSYVLGAALNHSFATLFSLLALFLFFRGLHGVTSPRAAAVGSGACIALAAFTRFNYASLLVVLLALWLIHIATAPKPRPFRLLLPFAAGVLIASLPALALIALAPAQFYFGNIVYIRLNTLYYEGLLFRQTMDLGSKVTTFLNGILHSPIDLVLYLGLLGLGVLCILRFLRTRSLAALSGFSVAVFAATMFLTAFSPTPTQAHYFFAPLPFMLVLVGLFAWELYERSPAVYAASFVALLLALVASVSIPNLLPQFAELLHPSDWTPVEEHAFAEGLRTIVPPGRILSLLPMSTMEAGYAPYAFTATGPFAWRTSLLLSHARRLYYEDVSPEELPALLDASPPVAILTGFEAPNAGFDLGDVGGLETPFGDYAKANRYVPVPFSPPFPGHTVTLWLKNP